MKVDFLPTNPIQRKRQLNEMASTAKAIGLVAFAFVLLGPLTAHAQQAMPWESFAKTLACSLQGPFIKWLAVGAIALGGMMFGLGELSGPFARVMQIAGGFSVSLGAVTIATMLFKTYGGALEACT